MCFASACKIDRISGAIAQQTAGHKPGCLLCVCVCVIVIWCPSYATKPALEQLLFAQPGTGAGDARTSSGACQLDAQTSLRGRLSHSSGGLRLRRPRRNGSQLKLLQQRNVAFHFFAEHSILSLGSPRPDAKAATPRRLRSQGRPKAKEALGDQAFFGAFINGLSIGFSMLHPKP